MMRMSGATEMNRMSGATEMNRMSGATEMNRVSGNTEMNRFSVATELARASAGSSSDEDEPRKAAAADLKKARQSIYDAKNNRISVYQDMRTNELIDQMLQEEFGSK